MLGRPHDRLVAVGRWSLSRSADRAGNVVDASNLAGVSAGAAGGSVDGEVSLSGLARWPVVHERRDPAVGHAAGQRQRAWAVRADPDLDRVCGCGSGMDACELVVVAVEAHPAALAVPECPNQGDRLLQCRQTLSRLPGRRPHRACCLEEAARADAELESAVTQQVECRGRFGEHRRRPERQVGDGVEDAHRSRLGEDRGSQRHRVEVAWLVGMVLDAEQVVAKVVREPRGVEHAGGVARVGDEEVAELERMPIVQTPVV